MVNIIVALIAIALIAITSAIAIFGLGDVFTSGGERAEFAKLKNEGGQIAIATNIYISRNAGAAPESVQQLVDERYLKVVPDALTQGDKSELWKYGFDNFVSLNVSNENVCMALNAQAGFTGSQPPSCSDGYDQDAPCCVAD